MSQNYWYPSGSATIVPGAVTANQGTPNTDANAWPVRITDGTHDATVTAGGALNVAISGLANPLPVQDSAAEASLSSIDGKTPTVGQKAMAASSPVVIASDQSAVPISAASLPLPTGASTLAAQNTGNASLASIDGHIPQLTLVGSALKVDGSSVTQPISAASLPLPTGASTSANQATEIASLSSIDSKLNSLGQKAMAASVPVVIASDQSTVPVSISSVPSQTGRALANAPARNVYSSVNVTTGAYVQLVASLSNAVNLVEVFDSSGQTMALAVGAPASEVIQFYIFPGGNGQVPLHIAAGSRVSIIAISATASVGEIDVNFYQ